eukprot:gene23481-29699_t
MEGMNGTSFGYGGLVNGQQYSFALAAINGNGEGAQVISANVNGHSAASSSVSATPSTSPNAVRNLHIVGNASELQIIWDAPADANGHPSGGLAYMYAIDVTDSNGDAPPVEADEFYSAMYDPDMSWNQNNYNARTILGKTKRAKVKVAPEAVARRVVRQAVQGRGTQKRQDHIKTINTDTWSPLKAHATDQLEKLGDQHMGKGKH